MTKNMIFKLQNLLQRNQTIIQFDGKWREGI